MKTLVIVPTYNESENILPLIEAVFTAAPQVHILVVDDNSPDGTGQIVEKQAKQETRLRLLSRAGKQGLGKAYLAGFAWALERGYDTVVEMDADFSHRPVDLVALIKESANWDFIVGSRWVPGGKTVNWGIGRKIISLGGSLYARLVLGFGLRDWTGGFNLWHVNTLRKIGLDSVRSEGYSFQIELKYRALCAGCRGREVPIVFEDRRVGQSKMSSRIVLEALYRVWGLRRSVVPIAERSASSKASQEESYSVD